MMEEKLPTSVFPVTDFKLFPSKEVVGGKGGRAGGEKNNSLHEIKSLSSAPHCIDAAALEPPRHRSPPATTEELGRNYRPGRLSLDQGGEREKILAHTGR
ncbi:hypothetical protein RRG08_066772 [Elysia crispata]|uniref:Uncharacterized protein n=1 Tax=Elysia crispata TaxID=231223 RepID=A0AAE0XPE6_9GAST|nr:hypothetical protein RRG08_066772 [Elysia crispata]